MIKPQLTPEQKLKKKKALRITGIVFLVLFAAITVLSLVYASEIDAFVEQYTGGGIVGQIVLAIPHVIYSVQIVFIVLLVLYILGLIYPRVFRGSPRRVTIGRLVAGLTRFLVWAVGVLAILAVWGVDVGALIASASILTVVIGLGMQSLISDIVAGIFLVSDGTLQVGDVVTIDGWRGTVQEIGLRNTRLINYSGDIRVANNSTIKVYINQSRVDSYPLVKVSVAYGEDLKRVERIFNENREMIKSHIPAILDGPDYNSVDLLDNSGVVLLFGAKCKEDDFFQVQRDLNRELKLLFDAYGIQIPFPQVVVHEGEADTHTPLRDEPSAGETDKDPPQEDL